MPAYITHVLAGEDFLKVLPPDRQRLIENNMGAYIWGLQGPDVLFFRNALRGGSPVAGYGSLMHKQDTEKLFAALTAYGAARKGKPDGELVLAYLAGFICHYTMDSTCHPYVYWLEKVRQCAGCPNPGGIHHEIESAIDGTLYRQRYLRPVSGFPYRERFVTDARTLSAIALLLSHLLERVYQIQLAPGEISLSIKDAYKCGRMMLDPTGGLLANGLRFFEDLAGVNRGLSVFVKREADYDVLNLQGNGWENLWEPGTARFESVPQLMKQAVDRAQALYQAVYDAILADEPYSPAPMESFDCGSPNRELTQK